MRKKALALVLWLLGCGAVASAQRETAVFVSKSDLGAAEEVPFVLQSQVAEVTVQLSATDRSGKPVSDLGPDDLQVWDNGELTPITQIRQEYDLPLRIALVIDWSDSMQKKLGFERKVAHDFLRTVFRPNFDQATVIGFRYRVEVTQALTGDLGSLEAGLRPVAGVSLSSVYDALIAAADELRIVDHSAPQSRAIVLLSDGEDNVSAHALSDVIQAAQRANIAIYTITPRGLRPTSDSDRVLKELTKATGGRAVFISRFEEQQALAKIGQDLRLGYTLYFKPDAKGGDGFRTLEVKPKDRNLQVSARHGYYADWD